MKKPHMKIGEFLTQKGYITEQQLELALKKQKQLPHILIGEILVAIGAFDSRKLFQYMKEYVRSLDEVPEHIRIWISQREINHLMHEYEDHEKKDG